MTYLLNKFGIQKINKDFLAGLLVEQSCFHMSMLAEFIEAICGNFSFSMEFM
jgi:uncharacterized membrane protein (Fun14 family)